MAADVDVNALSAGLRRLQHREGIPLESSLQRIVDACMELFELTGCGLMLLDEHGALRYVVATDASGRLLEDVQIETGEGPCIDSFVAARVVSSEDVRIDERWPVLAQRLAGGRVGAVLGAPVDLLGMPVGSLDVYCDSVHRWTAAERDAIACFAEVIGAVLTTAVRAEQAGELAARLSYALDHRLPVERATGFLMARDRLGRPAAFDRLCRSARSAGRRIGEVATDLLSTGRLPDDAA